MQLFIIFASILSLCCSACVDEVYRVNYTKVEISDVISRPGEFPENFPVSIKGNASCWDNPPQKVKDVAGKEYVSFLSETAGGDAKIACLSGDNLCFFRQPTVKGRLKHSKVFPFGVYVEVDFFHPEK
jgi:hypothetical protein